MREKECKHVCYFRQKNSRTGKPLVNVNRFRDNVEWTILSLPIDSPNVFSNNPKEEWIKPYQKER